MEKQRKDVDDKYKWNLELIYKDKNEVEKDISKIISKTKEIETYKNRITESSKTLLEVTEKYHDLMIIMDKLVVYSNMKLHEDMSVSENEKLVGKINKVTDEISEKLAFFTPEVLKSEYSLIKKYIKEEKGLEKYSFTFKEIFRDKNHSLSVNEEEMMARLGEVFSVASDTYDMLNDVNIKFEKIKDENGIEVELTGSNYSKYIKSENRNTRKEAFINMHKTYEELKNTFASLLKGNIKGNFFVSKTRKYNTPLEMNLYGDNIDKKLYLELIEKVNKNININYEYMKIIKEVLKLDELHLYDVYAPLVKEPKNNFTYEEAKEIVINALNPLGEEYIKNLKKIFDSGAIDVFNNKNKRGGAYSWGSYDTLPYVLLNFEGTFHDVSTIAHELGHSMHSLYSNKTQGYENHSYSIFLAEIASTVNEMLLNSYCSKNAKTKEEKMYYLNNLLEMFRTTLIRQTMFAEFEYELHEKEELGETLTEELISNTYYNLNKKYFGEEIVVDDLIKYEWARVPHFYTSFYVYQYATGISVAARIANDILKGKKGAVKNYIEFLSSGGNDYPLEILKKTGIDIINDDTIDKALNMFRETLDEFKKLI